MLNRMDALSRRSSRASLWLDAQAWALRRLRAAGRRGSSEAAHLETGEDGEFEALFHLRRRGYIVVARRWRTARLPGDLDLVAWQGSTLCFVEIKTRSRRDAFPAEMAVDEDKQRTLRRLARAYRNRLPASRRQALARFDVLSIYLAEDAAPDFLLLPGAFSWE